MSTHFLNANLTEKDGKTYPPQVFARDPRTDEPVWLNTPFADKKRMARLHAAITESKTEGTSHWVIDLDSLALAVEDGAIEVTDKGHTAISCSAAMVLKYAQCVANAVADEVDDEFENELAQKAQPVQRTITVTDEDEDEDDPFE